MLDDKIDYDLNGVDALVISTIKSAEEGVKNYMEKETELLSVILRQIGHRSKSISNFYLFIFLYLSRNLDNFIKAEAFDILKELGISPFSHVKSSVQRILNIIIPLESETYLEYSSTKLVHEILDYGLYSDIMLKLILDSIDDMLQKKESKLAKSVLNNQFFHDLFSQQLENTKPERITLRGIKLLNKITTYFWKNQGITYNEKAPKSKKKEKKTQKMILVISSTNISNLITYLKDFTSAEAHISNEIKTHGLSVFRQIAKLYDDIINLLTTEEFFCAKLVEFSRTDDRQLCSEGWKTIHHLISYHSGILELMIENKSLTSLISLISVTSSNIVIENGLHYLTKLFEITPKRKSKSVEKDIKTLALFYIDKKMYINLHLIVQKCDFSVFPGKIFFEIVDFFDMLFQTPAAKKILKDILKNQDFKTGIDKVLTLLGYDSKIFEKNSKKKRRKDWS